MKYLIDIKELDKEQIETILAQAQIIHKNSKNSNRNILKDKTIVNLFFENSTRTLVSFELAAKRLGADVINVNLEHSSTKKGETLKDTILTLQAMGVDAFIIRHPKNNICDRIKNWIDPNVALINAGDGNNQHPTQALLDIYTILQHKQNISDLKISIIGDIKHSRVANSLIDALSILGNRNIYIYGPKPLLPTEMKNTTICQTMKQALVDCDIIVMLRIQKERIQSQSILNLENYNYNFGLNAKTLSYASSNCIILHPGPINRGVEIQSEIADNPPSVILEQVNNGVLIRQSVLVTLL
jgi:aspartate carbamoyltransferase catalytic subunit